MLNNKAAKAVQNNAWFVDHVTSEQFKLWVWSKL
jgi:hypothetical protein